MRFKVQDLGGGGWGLQRGQFDCFLRRFIDGCFVERVYVNLVHGFSFGNCLFHLLWNGYRVEEGREGNVWKRGF